MLVCGLVAVIGFDDLVHEWGEGVVGIVGSGIDTDTGVGPLGAREDSLSESETEFIFSILALIPNFFGKAFLEKR